MQGQQEILQQCCQQLQNVEEQCQCEAVKQVFREAQQQVQQQQGPQSVPFLSSQQTQRLRQKAQALPNVCNLQSRRCQIGSIGTTVTESNMDIPVFDWPYGTGSGSQQCRQSEIQRPVTQCQRFVEQQMQSQRPFQQRPRQQHQGLQQCCNELQNVQRECQCEAVEEVARRVMRQPQHQQQQQRRQQQRGQFGGQEMEIARRVIQNLPNECSLEVQQCNIPYGMI
ncbi:hypothetical protein M8C21_033340 [Ambrosia artemisiifolia]|uniref:Bifunctional inhibitor/plant lipid transfer protein/seed storage helical domain-containing protein n=1 Tax=Ambrosia artemisiifolia TaxID=4212 RepID=A0AAD5GNX1_AMBAR|nr:hypothetical protein M8C21_033340 [Ambrosia artemisiifolia]